jgi:hypothetical protein
MHCILHEVSQKELHAFAHASLTILTLRMAVGLPQKKFGPVEL